VPSATVARRGGRARIRERIEACCRRASAISQASSSFRKSMLRAFPEFPTAPRFWRAVIDGPSGALVPGRPQAAAEKALNESPIPAAFAARARTQGRGQGDAGRRRPGLSDLITHQGLAPAGADVVLYDELVSLRFSIGRQSRRLRASGRTRVGKPGVGQDAIHKTA